MAEQWLVKCLHIKIQLNNLEINQLTYDYLLFVLTMLTTKNSVASCKMKEKRPALIGYLARPQRLKCNQSGYFGDLMKRSLFVEQHNLCHDTRAHGIVFLSDVFTLINLSGYSLASGAFFTSGETGMERNFY